MWIFSIFYIFCGAEGSAWSTCPVLVIGSFLGQKKGFHVAQRPGVWGVRDVRDSGALTSLRTPGLQTEELCLKPAAHRAWLLAANLRERKWERRLVSKYILSPCSSLNGSIEQVAGLVQALPPLECIGLCEWWFLCMEYPPLAQEPGRVTQSYGRKETVNRGSHRTVMPIAKVSLPRERFSIASQLLPPCCGVTVPPQKDVHFHRPEVTGFFGHHEPALRATTLPQRKGEKLAVTTVSIEVPCWARTRLSSPGPCSDETPCFLLRPDSH